MRRRVLAISLEEVRQHLLSNDRQDLKVVVPEILGRELYEKLAGQGRRVKREEPVEDVKWEHSRPEEANRVCESSDFESGDGTAGQGLFALAFANEKAAQDEHFHPHHVEIYYSEHRMYAEFLCPGETERRRLALEQGGALVFGPGVIHRVTLTGLTLIIEAPSVKDDKVRVS